MLRTFLRKPKFCAFVLSPISESRVVRVNSYGFVVRHSHFLAYRKDKFRERIPSEILNLFCRKMSCDDSPSKTANCIEVPHSAAGTETHQSSEVGDKVSLNLNSDKLPMVSSEENVVVNNPSQVTDSFEHSGARDIIVTSQSVSDMEFSGNFISVGCQCTPKIQEESILVMKYCWTDEEDEASGKENEGDSSSEQVGADKEKGGGTGDGRLQAAGEKRKAEDGEPGRDLKKAKLETKALKAKRPGFTDDRYNETSYYIENGLRKVYPYYFTFTTFTKGRWVGERILDVFAREFRAHPAEEYERCIRAGTLTVNYEKVDVDYRLKHNDLLANVVHRHEVPVTSEPITIVHMDEDVVVVNKPASIPVHPCGRYRHNTVVFILAKEYNLRNLRTIHRLDRLTSGLLLFGRTPKKARAMEHQIRNRQVVKEYVCRVEGDFPSEVIECEQPIEVVSYKIGVCKVSPRGKHCTTTFQKLGFNGKTSVISCKPHTGRMHQIRVHLQYLGYPVVNDPLYNHTVFGPEKGRGGNIGKTDEELIRDLINIHNAENWLGMDGDSELSMFKRTDLDEAKGCSAVDEEPDVGSREPSPCDEAGDAADSPPASAAGPPPAPPAPPTPPSALPPPPPPPPPQVVRPPAGAKVTVATQTGQEAPDLSYNPEKLTWDEHCYECKVRYRDPKPKDLVMYLHAWKYKGPGWSYETELPDWARVDWVEQDD